MVGTASASASRAAAGLSGARAKAIPAQIEADEALAAQREQDTITSTLDKTKRDPLNAGEYDVQSDQGVRYNLTQSLMTTMPLPQAVGMADTLTRMTPEELGTLNADGGVWHLPNGTQVPVTHEFTNALNSLMQAAGVGVEEE
jgi:hypothetical protein